MADHICVDWGPTEELTHLGGSAKVRANYQDYSSQESAQHCLIYLHPSSNPQQTWSQLLACSSQNLCSSALPVALWVTGPHLLSKCSIWKVLVLSSSPPCPSLLTGNCCILPSLYSLLTFVLQEHQWHGAQRWQNSSKKMRGATAMSYIVRAKKGEYSLCLAEWSGLNYKCTRASWNPPKVAFFPVLTVGIWQRKAFFSPTSAYTNRVQGTASLLRTK